MAEDKRTRAELLRALDAAALEHRVAVDDVEAQAAKEIQMLRARLDRQTPEARAVDMCVTALDNLNRIAKDRSDNSRGTYLRASSYGYAETMPLDAVGQVLAYLRVRYGQIDPSGEVEHLRQRVNSLLNENGQLREQLQQIAQNASAVRP